MTPRALLVPARWAAAIVLAGLASALLVLVVLGAAAGFALSWPAYELIRPELH